MTISGFAIAAEILVAMCFPRSAAYIIARGPVACLVVEPFVAASDMAFKTLRVELVNSKMLCSQSLL